jgi:hypothetical protein
MAIKANFTTGVLSVTADNGGDDITVTRDAAEQILINGEAPSIQGDQPPTLTNTTRIDVFGGNGNDTISLDNVAPPLGQTQPKALPTAHLFGGNGNDTLNGGAGNDFLDGGNGNDTVAGGKGADMASLGAGNDTFIWNNGDGSDVVEGQAGFDTLVFNGNVDKNVTEEIKIFANGSRATLSRTQGNITMDLNSVERIELNDALGGADNITINDLTGTDVKEVAIDLGVGADNITIDAQTGTDLKQFAIDLGADGDADRVNIATNGPFTVTDVNGVITVSDLTSTVTIANFHEATDHLFINGQDAAALLGQFMASSFVTAGAAQGATPVSDQPVTQQQPLLAQPHF